MAKDTEEDVSPDGFPSDRIDMEHLTEDQKPLMVPMLQRRYKAFSRNEMDLGHCKMRQFKINIREEMKGKPIVQPPRKFPPHKQKIIQG